MKVLMLNGSCNPKGPGSAGSYRTNGSSLPQAFMASVTDERSIKLYLKMFMAVDF